MKVTWTDIKDRNNLNRARTLKRYILLYSFNRISSIINMVSFPPINLIDSVIDEVALEGLDGITLEGKSIFL